MLQDSENEWTKVKATARINYPNNKEWEKQGPEQSAFPELDKKQSQSSGEYIKKKNWRERRGRGMKQGETQGDGNCR